LKGSRAGSLTAEPLQSGRSARFPRPHRHTRPAQKWKKLPYNKQIKKLDASFHKFFAILPETG